MLLYVDLFGFTFCSAIISPINRTVSLLILTQPWNFSFSDSTKRSATMVRREVDRAVSNHDFSFLFHLLFSPRLN